MALYYSPECRYCTFKYSSVKNFGMFYEYMLDKLDQNRCGYIFRTLIVYHYKPTRSNLR